MEYVGQVKNGVVVLEGGPPLAEGTRVRVSAFAAADDPQSPPRGSAAAILRSAARWHGPPEEMDALLEELRRTKWAEVEAQRNAPVDDLIDTSGDARPPGDPSTAGGGG
jgi:hypothetical protein